MVSIYEYDKTLAISKPFGKISLLDAIKDLREEGTPNYFAKISTVFVIV